MKILVCSKLKYRGLIYQKGFCITNHNTDNFLKLFEIDDLLIIDNKITIVCNEYILKRYNGHFSAYEVADQKNEEYCFFQIHEFTGPPIHIHYSANGLKLIRVKYF